MNTSFQRHFATGILGWLFGSLAIFAAVWTFAKPEALANALIWSLSYWWIAYAIGFLALVVGGASTGKSLWRAALAYLLPMAILAGVVGLFLAIYPDAGFRDELLSYLPVVVVFYVFGYFWIRVRKQEADLFVRAVFPPIVGGLLILAFVAVPTFASNAFLYKDAFGFRVVKTRNREGVVQADAVLEIHKPGHYQFVVRHFSIYDSGSGPETGEVAWGEAGEPKEGMTGSFPLGIRWHQQGTPHELPPMPESMDSAVLEVRDAKAPETVIYTLVSQLPGDTQ